MIVTIGNSLVDLDGVIFDMDGTILDSMPCWKELAGFMSERYGHVLTKQVEKTFLTGTSQEMAECMIEQYRIDCDKNKLIDEINSNIESEYRETMLLKSGVWQLMEYLSEHQIKIAVATASEAYLVRSMLKRTGIDVFVDEVVSCSEVGKGKHFPDVYDLACKRLGICRQEAVVVEDALYAIKTAKKNGYFVLGVEEPAMAHDCARIKKRADCYVSSLDVWLQQLVKMEGDDEYDDEAASI